MSGWARTLDDAGADSFPIDRALLGARLPDRGRSFRLPNSTSSMSRK